MDLWRVEEVEPRRVVMDFTSSGQGRPAATQLVAEGEILANAIESTTWSTDPVQAVVCSECGIERCASGGWVSPCRSDGRLLWTPAFAAMADDENEFGPPRYFVDRGAPVFEPEAATAVSRAVGLGMGDVRSLTSRDLALLLQWAAPARLLGVVPSAPRIRREDVLATTLGDRDQLLDRLDELLADAINSTAEVALRPAGEEAERVGLFLDLPGHPEWSPLVRVGGSIKLAAAGLIAHVPT